MGTEGCTSISAHSSRDRGDERGLIACTVYSYTERKARWTVSRDAETCHRVERFLRKMGVYGSIDTVSRLTTYDSTWDARAGATGLPLARTLGSLSCQVSV